MYPFCKIDMKSLKFVEACSSCLDHRFLRGLRLQAFHSSDVIGLFGIVERSPEITLVKESTFLRKNVFAIHVAGVKFGSYCQCLKVRQRSQRKKTSRGYQRGIANPRRTTKRHAWLERERIRWLVEEEPCSERFCLEI